MLEIEIRPAVHSDVPQIVDLQLELGRHHRQLGPDNPRYQISQEDWTQQIQSALDNGSSRFLVATQRGLVCGFVRLTMVDKPWGVSCEMDTIVVEEGLRGQGVGQRLVEAAEQTARAAGARAIRANVLSRNSAGGDFYRDNGYSDIAVRFGKSLE